MCQKLRLQNARDVFEAKSLQAFHFAIFGCADDFWK